MARIQWIDDLPYNLEEITCTCRKYPNWRNESIFSEEWGRSIHKQCMKPTQDQVIYLCCRCEEYFISKTLHPTTRDNELVSVIYIARCKSGPYPNMFKIKEVYCDDCPPYV